MIQRCLNSGNLNFRHYGGRGIKICERWLKFENFLADMGERPEGLSIDRIDVNGNYEPSNCRWAAQALQHANRRPVTYLPKYKDLTGGSFGLWRVLKLSRTKPKVHWLCRCECGTEKEVMAQSLTALVSGSCGCVSRAWMQTKNPVEIRWARRDALRADEALAACGVKV